MAGEAQAKQGSAAEDGSDRRRLRRALGVGGAWLGHVARRDRGAGGAGELRRHGGGGGGGFLMEPGR